MGIGNRTTNGFNNNNGNSAAKKTKTKGPKHDGAGSLLLDALAQQNYSDAPFQRLLRPQPSPDIPAARSMIAQLANRLRGWRRHWRLFLAVGVAFLCLLFVWLFLLGPLLFRRERRPVLSAEKGMLYPSYSPNLTKTKGRGGQNVKNVYLSAIHNLPTEGPLTTVIDKAKIATNSKDSEDDEAEEVDDDEDVLVVDKIDLPLNASTTLVVFKIKAAVEMKVSSKNNKSVAIGATSPPGPVSGKTLQATLPPPFVHPHKPTKSTSPTTTKTTPTTTTSPTFPTKATTTITTTTTTTTTVKPEESSSSSEPFDSEDEEDLFWMRGRKPPVPEHRTLLGKQKFEEQRKTIKYEPVDAIQSGYAGKKGSKTTKNEQSMKKGLEKEEVSMENVQVNKAEKASMKTGAEKEATVEEELNEIIEDLDGTTKKTNEQQKAGSGVYVAHGKGGVLPVYLPPPISPAIEHEMSASDNIQPVEIDFSAVDNGSSNQSMGFAKNHRGKTISAERVMDPVWRRKPPDEQENRAKMNEKPKHDVQLDYNLNEMPMLPENAELQRKRRKAPILVTALFDIGRGNWVRFTRHFDQYLDYLTNMLLSLENNVILYCEPTVVRHLIDVGARVDWRRIQVVEIGLIDLPFFRWREEIQEIIEREQNNWPEQWDKKVKEHPEALHADYDVVVNSKSYFMYNATQISRFGGGAALEHGTQFFVWVDSGYGHGSSTVFPKGVWSPMFPRDKITAVQLNAQERAEKYTIEMVYRKHKSVVTGGVLAGNPDAIKRFHVFFIKTFMDLLDSGRVDDDQTTLLMTIAEYRSLFHLVHGGWFNAFTTLFPSLPERE